MREPIIFFVAGIPKGQPRPKAVMRGKHAGVYDPGTANEWKNQIYIQGKNRVPPEPWEGPLRVSLTFYFPRPRKHYRTGNLAHLLRDDAPLFHTSTPDRDNADKAVLDQLTVMRFWKDDAQACDGRIKKLYGERPGVEVEIHELAL